jgi:hypothetical protein
MDAAEWPLDVTALQKGEDYDVFAMGIATGQPGSARARLELLRIREVIQQKANDEGLTMSLRTKGDRHIRVMTDDEAATYHDARASGAVAKLGRQVRCLAKNVDRSKLIPDRQREHDGNIARRAMQYLAATRPRKHVTDSKAASFLKRILPPGRPNPFKEGGQNA